MTKIADVSHHQGVIDWSKASKELHMAIIRVQYGSKTEDRYHKRNAEEAVKHGVPFGQYAYGHYVSVADAIVEAKDFLKRIHKDTKFLVLDVEDDTLKSCGSANLAKASQAFIDTCKAAGYKTGLYVSHHLYDKHDLNTIKADFLWIPRYSANDNGTPVGPKPKYTCDIWQYTERGKLSGVTGGVDLNQLISSKDLSFYIGGSKVVAKPVSSSPKKDESSKSGGKTYTVKAGDTFWGISKKLGVNVNELMKLNSKYKPEALPVGAVLKIPGKATSSNSSKAVDKIGGIKVLGKIKIVNVSKAAFVCDKPSKISKNLGTAKLGETLYIAGSVPGWYEVIWNQNGKYTRAYVNQNYAKRV
ncbi:LysM peptidoglycan-binding domain-containing protein [Bacillus haynesii]|uniref:GH25 family lysozyme n=1 Tax=Bacillus haynesii TaxID=1925021 RepID=UPI00227E025B|nr:GH25 family lysozyme [Bacillus haynesii]MCY8577074.1 LysM peptidoglycan-binding domain-containing protein [Bacillus haynesii]MEC1657227.1 GH25 family lysozyme [Bacillus haynesii]